MASPYGEGQLATVWMQPRVWWGRGTQKLEKNQARPPTVSKHRLRKLDFTIQQEEHFKQEIIMIKCTVEKLISLIHDETRVGRSKDRTQNKDCNRLPDQTEGGV